MQSETSRLPPTGNFPKKGTHVPDFAKFALSQKIRAGSVILLSKTAKTPIHQKSNNG
jgi:hypothetical protein